MTMAKSLSLAATLARLKSLHDGDAGLLDVTRFGARAIPALRMLLFEREPSGLYQARCRAVEALAALGAHETLVDFLATSREIADPVERVGEDAVINAAGRAAAHDLCKLRVGGEKAILKERALQALLTIARHRPLAGVIGALGAFGRRETIPLIVAALQEDECRLTAERVLRQFGLSARPVLLKATTRSSSSEQESESSIRARTSALALLSEMTPAGVHDS
jgi:HEAT repeat protein